MANSDEIQKRGREATEAYIRKHLVAIDQEDIAAGKRFIGSATCVEIANRIFLCTAAHNFRVIPKGGKVTFVSTYPRAKEPLTVVAYNYSDYGRKGTLDTAWVEIEPESAIREKLEGVMLGVIDPYHMMDVENGTYAMVGLPAEFYKLTSNPVYDNTPLLVYYSKPGRSANEMDDRLFVHYAEKTVRPTGEVLDMPDPGGISGGGMWSVPYLDKSEVWSAYKYGLVGLNIEYLDVSGQIVGMRMHHWLKLVLKDNPELRDHIDPVLKR